MRIGPDPTGSEFRMLSQYLDYQRETLLSKTDGLTREQLARKHSPSELTLGGLLFHLSLVEENWMEVRFAGLPDREPWADVDWNTDPNWDFRTAAHLEPMQLQSRYREACDRSRDVVSKSTGLDQRSAKALRDGSHFSLQWVLLHLVEETARHAGHADFLRRRGRRCCAHHCKRRALKRLRALRSEAHPVVRPVDVEFRTHSE